MTKQVVRTGGAPSAIGPYSQAIRIPAGKSLVFCSGQVALDPVSGEMVGSGDVRVQARRVMENLAAVLLADVRERNHLRGGRPNRGCRRE